MTCADRKYRLHAPCIGNCIKCPVKSRAVIYGPVASRRRGRSLGINLYPLFKVCSFDCVYCLRGRTIAKISNPIDYICLQLKPEHVLRYLSTVLNKIETDTVDLSGNGEPTLYPRFLELCREVSKICKEYSIKSLGLFTNSTQFQRRQTVQSLKYIDHVEAKLDTFNEHKFRIINRPAHGITLSKVIEGLAQARKYVSELSVQIMLCKMELEGSLIFTVSDEDVHNMIDVLCKIEPDVVHLYTVYRMPYRTNVYPVSINEVESVIEKLRAHGFKFRIFI